MRMLLLASVLLLAAPVFAQTDYCATFGPGSPSCPYQWVGATATLYDGSGNGLGFVGMTSQCRAEYGPGARMCTSQEVLDSDTLNLNGIPSSGCWVRPSWRSISTASFSSLALDESGVSGEVAPGSGDNDTFTCRGWTNDFRNGLSLLPTGGFQRQLCSVARSVACCAPTPIPSPTSSLSIPIGAGALVGLASMRGGA